MEKQFRNIGFFFLPMIGFIALGFYFPYFSLFPDFKSITTLIHIHALSLMLWAGIMMVQPFLIRFGKYKTHKLIGRFTYFLFPIVLLSIAGVIRHGYDVGISEKMTTIQSLKAQYTNLFELVAVVLFYFMAIMNIRKGNVARHARYMICLFLVFIPPSLGRTLGYWFGVQPQSYSYTASIIVSVLILLALIIVDIKRKSDFSPYVVALIVYAIANGVWFLLGHPI